MAEQNVILKVLADVAGANASFKQMQKALSDLSGGALTLGKNFNVFQKGVQGSIGAQQAAEAVSKQYLATMRQRLTLSKAEAAGLQALTVLHKAEAAAMQAKLAVMKAEAAADDLALKQMQQELSLRKMAVQEIELENRERRALNASKVASVSATSAATGAVASNTAAMQENNVAAGAATFALTSLGQGLADAGQFGMGFAQGMRAITNNAQQVVFAMVMLRQQAGTTAASFAMLRSVMTGPLGFLFAFQAGSALLEGFLSWQQRAKKGNKELADSFKELIEAMGGLSPIPMALSDIESRIDGLRSEMDGLGLAAEPFLQRLILIREGYLGLGDLFSDAASRGAALREEIRKWQELLAGPVPFVSEDERFRGVMQAELDELGKKMGEFSDEIKLNADPAIRALREQVSLFEDTAKSGAGSVDEFSVAYAAFSERLASVADGAEITRSEFAKLMSEGRVEEFLKEEQWKRVDGWLKSIAATVERINLSRGLFAVRGRAMSNAEMIDEGPGSLSMPAGMAAFIEDHQKYIDAQGRVIDANQKFRESFAQFGADLIVSFATIGGGMDGLKRTFGRFLTAYGAELVKMGVAQIALGVSLAAVKRALESLNGPAAIAAGVALVAAGSALRAQGRKSASALSGGGSGRSSAPAYFTSGGGYATFASGGITQSLSPFRAFPDALPGGYVMPGLLGGGYGKSPMMRVQLVASGRDLISVAGNEIAASGRGTYMSPFTVVGGGSVEVGTGGGGGGYGGEWDKLI